MKHRLSTIILTPTLMLFVVALLLVTGCGWGDAIYTVRVLNQTEQDVTIFVTVHPAGHTTRIGSVEPGKEITFKGIYYDKYLYEAKNAQGEVIYSKEFTIDEMQEMEWKVVITPSPE